jgi:hypothetical protein
VACGSREAIDDIKAGHDIATLHLADESLGYASTPRKLGLRQAGHCARRNELAGEARRRVPMARTESHAGSPHAGRIGRRGYCAVTAC